MSHFKKRAVGLAASVTVPAALGLVPAASAAIPAASAAVPTLMFPAVAPLKASPQIVTAELMEALKNDSLIFFLLVTVMNDGTSVSL